MLRPVLAMRGLVSLLQKRTFYAITILDEAKKVYAEYLMEEGTMKDIDELKLQLKDKFSEETGRTISVDIKLLKNCKGGEGGD